MLKCGCGCVDQQVVKKWLFLEFLGVASFRRICPECRKISQRAVCSGSLSLSPGWACFGGDNCNVFLWPRKASNYHCKGPTERGVGGLTLSHELHSAPAVGPSTPLFPFTVHTTNWTSASIWLILETCLSLCSCCSQIYLICCLH